MCAFSFYEMSLWITTSGMTNEEMWENFRLSIIASFLQFSFQATPFFISLMLLELIVSWIRKGKPPGRLDDALTSISAGVLSQLPRWISWLATLKESTEILNYDVKWIYLNICHQRIQLLPLYKMLIFCSLWIFLFIHYKWQL